MLVSDDRSGTAGTKLGTGFEKWGQTFTKSYKLLNGSFTINTAFHKLATSGNIPILHNGIQEVAGSIPTTSTTSKTRRCKQRQRFSFCPGGAVQELI